MRHFIAAVAVSAHSLRVRHATAAATLVASCGLAQIGLARAL